MKPQLKWGFGLCLLAALHGDAKPRPLVLDAHWMAPFAGETAEIAATVSLEAGRNAILHWDLTVGSAVVERGESAIPTGEQGPRVVRIPLQLPPVRPDVRLGAVLRARLHDARTGAELGRDLRRFPLLGSNPFAGRSTEFERLRIVLFDPRETLAEKLSDLGVTVEVRQNVASLLEGPPGLLLIAEGLSFKDYRGLPDILWQSLSAGIPTLCLSPLEGSISLPLAVPSPTGSAQVRLADRNRAVAMDKPDGYLAWGVTGPPIAGSMRLSGRGEELFGAFSPDDAGWPWVEFQGGSGDAKLVFCGFGVVAAWDQTPAARWLLRLLIEQVTQKPE